MRFHVHNNIQPDLENTSPPPIPIIAFSSHSQVDSLNNYCQLYLLHSIRTSFHCGGHLSQQSALHFQIRPHYLCFSHYSFLHKSWLECHMSHLSVQRTTMERNRDRTSTIFHYSWHVKDFRHIVPPLCILHPHIISVNPSRFLYRCNSILCNTSRPVHLFGLRWQQYIPFFNPLWEPSHPQFNGLELFVRTLYCIRLQSIPALLPWSCPS